MTMTVAALLPSSSYAEFALPGCPKPANEPEMRDCRPPASPHKVVRFQGDASTFLRVRKSVFELTPYEVDQLRRAFGELRRLSVEDPTDPRGWQLQANVHCWNCAGAAPPEGAGIDVHGHYWFLPWHRAYLYFFEKILGELIDEPDFALPYWDWDTKGRRRLPSAYIAPDNVDINPLFDATRRGGDACLPLERIGPKPMEKLMFDTTDWRAFMGGEAPSVPAGPVDPTQQGIAGLLEFTVHNSVHGWVPAPGPRPAPGQPRRCGRPNMGIFSISAQDPIFFAHHANVDRLWETWWRAGGEQRLPPDERWRKQTFRFYDERANLVEISVDQVIDTAGWLGYGYRPPSPAGDEDTCPAQMAGAMALTVPATTPVAPLVTGETHVLTFEPHTLVPPVLEFPNVGFLGPGPASLAQPTPRVHIDGVSLRPGETATVRVLIGDPNNPTDESYFTVIPHHSHHTPTQNIAIPLTLQAQQLLQPVVASGFAGGAMMAQGLQVTLVPVPPDDEPQAFIGLAGFGAYAVAAAEAPVVAYGNVYITR
ncbi:tyrosinase family protein [Sorangium sp. So ce341]|uniref:tyrosinase family protein n=1 Tax=Sorangium sp. So ce341 TaxID=3133302 RepID=UPI003F604954